ncbi:MAG: ATP-binding cassette domain-containing protein [Streptosporangiaceae bacterium]
MEEWAPDSRIGRRRFLQMGGVAATSLTFGGLLSACGSSGGATTASDKPVRLAVTHYPGFLYGVPWAVAVKDGIADNVTFGLEADGVRKPERVSRAREMLELVGLGGFADYYPDQLSGGMRQRVAIARTLVTSPKVILLDEPFGALDEQTRLILGEELLGIWARTAATTVFITHSISEAAMLADRVLIMTGRPGRVRQVVDVRLGRPRDSRIISSPQYSAVTGEIWRFLREESLKVHRDGQVAAG